MRWLQPCCGQPYPTTHGSHHEPESPHLRRHENRDESSAVVDKMLKQRRDSITQYEAAQRQDLADKEKAEMAVLTAYLPQQLTAEEIDVMIDGAIAASGAAGMQDMGKVMALLKPHMAGRADMGAVSARIKAKLAG